MKITVIRKEVPAKHGEITIPGYETQQYNVIKDRGIIYQTQDFMALKLVLQDMGLSDTREMVNSFNDNDGCYSFNSKDKV